MLRNRLSRHVCSGFAVSAVVVVGCFHSDDDDQPVGGVSVGPDAFAFSIVSEETGWNFPDLFVMERNGLSRVRLTSDPGFDGMPAWSPDRKQIAFSSNRGGSHDIYVISLSNRRIVQLTHVDKGAEHPDWSQDGSRLVFEAHWDHNPEIYVMDADGGNQKNLTNHESADMTPCWSPDGSRIAFSSDRDESDRWQFEIYSMNQDGSDVRRLTVSDPEDSPLQGWAGTPAWSPDGFRIAFVSQRGGSDYRDVYVMKPDGTEVLRLTDDGVGTYAELAWSPDGDVIAVLTWDRVWAVSPGGSDFRTIAGPIGGGLSFDW